MLLNGIGVAAMTSKALPDYTLQETCSTIALACRNKVMTGKKCKCLICIAQHLLCKKLYRGSEGFASYAELFCQGRCMFEMAFTCSAVENNQEGNEFRGDGKVHELRAQLHCNLQVGKLQDDVLRTIPLCLT